VTRIKICGITCVEGALATARSGVDFMGLVFAPSRRQVSVEEGLRLAEAARGIRNSLAIIGVFVNARADEVNCIAGHCLLDWVQLSGDESWQYCEQIERPVIKAIHVSDDSRVGAIGEYIESGYRVLPDRNLICLLDTRVEGAYGGTGQIFNWQLAKELSSRYSVIVAGGLTSENVGRLVREAQPWGVDVSTGVESNGLKDGNKIMDFVASVRKAEATSWGLL